MKDIPLKLIESYLKDRVQYVSLNNENSGFLPVTCGVRQGSVLGPLLFLIMINDLALCTSEEVVLYADDTTVVNRHLSSSHALELAKKIKILYKIG